jgi:hypothetical protein
MHAFDLDLLKQIRTAAQRTANYVKQLEYRRVSGHLTTDEQLHVIATAISAQDAALDQLTNRANSRHATLDRLALHSPTPDPRDDDHSE